MRRKKPNPAIMIEQERFHCMAEISQLVELKIFHEQEGDFLMFSTAKTNKRVVACEKAVPKAFSKAKRVGALLSEQEVRSEGP